MDPVAKAPLLAHPAYLVGDSNGTPGLTTVMTSAEVALQVAWANNVYGGSNVELLYNRTVPSGTGGQLSTVFNTLINNGGYDTGDPGWKEAQFRAERFPADISVFFPHGPVPNMETVGGASNPSGRSCRPSRSARASARGRKMT